MKKEHIAYIDFASGIMILWMVVYHAMSCAWSFEANNGGVVTNLPDCMRIFITEDGAFQIFNPCMLIPYLHFFMPWFFYKSGHFFNKMDAKDLWRKDSNKMLKNFLVWSILGFVLYIIIGLHDHSLTLRNTTYSILRELFLKGKLPINTPLWFLLTLFGVRFIANVLLPKREDKYAMLKSLCVVLIGYTMSCFIFFLNCRLLPYWIANSFAGMCFFCLGYIFRDLEKKQWLIALSTVVYVFGCIFGFPIVDMWPNSLISGHYCLWIPIGFFCIIFFNAVCRFLYDYVRVKPIEIIGKNAMIIYVSHMLIISLVTDILLGRNNIVISYGGVLVLILVVFALLLPMCCWIGKNILVKL